MSLKKILSAAAFTLAGLAGSVYAQDDCDPRSDNLTATYAATLTGAIGESAKKHLLELASQGFQEEPWESKMRDFERYFGSVKKPVDKNNLFRPGFGYVTHQSDPDKKTCVIYLYRDTNQNGIQDIGGDVKEELHEKEILCIPRNTFIDERNAPYVAACDEHVGAFEKIFNYQLFVPQENKMGNYKFAPDVYGLQQRTQMEQCLANAAADGIRRHEDNLVISTEGAAVIQKFNEKFGSLSEPQRGSRMETRVFTAGKKSYAFLFADTNNNKKLDTGESLLNIIQKNDTITPYSDVCAIPPEQGVMTLDEKIEQLKRDNKYAELAGLLVQEGRKEEAIDYYTVAKEPDKAASLAESIGNLESAAKIYVAAKKPEKAAQTLESLAVKHLAEGKEKEAQDAYLQASLNYETAGEHLRAAHAAEKAGDLERALDSFMVVDDYKNIGRLSELLGKINAEKKDKASLGAAAAYFDEAINAYEEAGDDKSAERVRELMKEEKESTSSKTGSNRYLGGIQVSVAGTTEQVEFPLQIGLFIFPKKIPVAFFLDAHTRLGIGDSSINTVNLNLKDQQNVKTIFSGDKGEYTNYHFLGGNAGVLFGNNPLIYYGGIGIRERVTVLGSANDENVLWTGYRSLEAQLGVGFSKGDFAATLKYGYERAYDKISITDVASRYVWAFERHTTPARQYVPIEELATHNMRLNAYYTANSQVLFHGFARSEGAHIPPACNILSCSGAYGLAEAGANIWIHPLAKEAKESELVVSIGLGGAYRTSGLNPYFSHNGEFVFGVRFITGFNSESGSNQKNHVAPIFFNW